MRHYNADAAINGLGFDRHEEELAAQTFVRSIRSAARAFMEDPLGAPLIPNWNRVQAALPNFFEELNDGVRQDNE
jgi:glucosyl-3-phosphoglycerate synthase